MELNMILRILPSEAYDPCFANDNNALIPEVWAMESLLILFENTVYAQLIHREFRNEVARQGDTVHTHRPAKFTSKRKVDGDAVTKSDATLTDVEIKLNQHHHVAFHIYDVESSTAMQSLIETHLEPAVQAIAQAIDEAIDGQKYEFLANVVGKLGTALTKATIIETTVKLDENLCPPDRRRLVVSPNSYGDLLNLQEFTTIDYIGEDGTALRSGSLGDRLGFQIHKSHNCRTITNTDSDIIFDTMAINNGNLTVGSTVITVDGDTEDPAAGMWCTIAGDMTPQLITGWDDTAKTLTISPGLRNAIVNDAAVTIYTPAYIDLADGYAAGYAKLLEVDDATDALDFTPQAGRMFSTGVTAGTLKCYSVMSGATTTAITPNRPLDSAVANNAVCGLGPIGDYNFAFHRNAITLVSRPLQVPQTNLADSVVVDMDGFGVRVTITYDGDYQAHLCTVDILFGVKTLDTNLGCLVLAG